MQDLSGGYILINYKMDLDNMLLFPFVRYQHYDGGKKHERDARSYLVDEVEIGVEWQPTKYLEMVAMYTISDRTTEDFLLEDNQQSGNLLRLQLQLNF